MFLFWLGHSNIITTFPNTTQGQNILRKYVNPVYYVSREPCDNTNSDSRRQSVDYVLGLAIASVTNPKGFFPQIQINFHGDDDQRTGVCLGILDGALGCFFCLRGGGVDHYLRTPIGRLQISWYIDHQVQSESQSQAVDVYKSTMMFRIFSKAYRILWYYVCIHLSHRSLAIWCYFGLGKESITISFSKPNVQ